MSGARLATNEVRQPAPAEQPALSQRQIALFWLPLAASWLMMTLESPVTTGVLARLPDPARMLAAFGIAFSLAVTIESPVIMLLGTTTALARDRQAYRQIRAFTLILAGVTTLLLAAMWWPPLFDLVVRRAMGVPEAIADGAQPGLRILLFWSAAIAWRRFKQGVMIRHGGTRWIGYGTMLRLATTIAVALGLGLWSGWPGVAVGATALMAGVAAEMVFAHIAANDYVARVPPAPAGASGYRELSLGDLARYHMPLAATSLLILFGQPIIGAALARSPEPELALAAWPVVFGLLLIFRAPGLALPEVVIAKLGESGAAGPVRRFALTVALAASTLLALMALTPLAGLYYRGVIGVPPEVARAAVPGVQLGLLVPFAMALQGWQRGRLMHLKVTAPITAAMLVNLATLAGLLALGSTLRLPGVALAGGSLSLAMMVECLFLAWRSRRVRPAQSRASG